MDHRDHVELLREGVGTVTSRAAQWADIGAGEGAFTLALADLLGPGASIIALDRDARALQAAELSMSGRFPEVALRTVVGDLEAPPPSMAGLDGLVAANSLHFVPRDRQVAAVTGLSRLLRPGGTFLVVEYDDDSGDRWVPYPFSARRWPRIASAAGLQDAREIARVRSRFHGAIYAAVARQP